MAKVLDPHLYGSLGRRENNYLIALLVLLGIIASYGVRERVLPLLDRYRAAMLTGRTLAYGIMIALVFTFLRPINQFIYFQFW